MSRRIRFRQILPYLIVTVAFLVWIIFFDNNSLLHQRQVTRQLDTLNTIKVYYEGEIEKNRKAMEELMTNKETMEKYAREKFLMKRDSEDVYVIVKDEEQQPATTDQHQ